MALTADLFTLLGLLVVLGAAASYFAMLFIVHGFTYRTWTFHAVVIAGMLMAVAGWLAGGNPIVALAALASGVTWFVVSQHELTLVGSRHLKLRVGDPMPSFGALTTAGQPITEHDLVANGPALLVLYRGWWCPSSKTQLDELHRYYTQFESLGVAVFAGSVDNAAEAVPLQERVGKQITILGNITEELLDAIGVRDERGAPWYDRLLFGVQEQAIAMPSALVLDRNGTIVLLQRARRVDERPRPTDVLAKLASTSSFRSPESAAPRG